MKRNKWIRESYKESKSDLVPGQAMSAQELWERFNRGQRLVINQRPINLYPADSDGNYVDKSIKDETIENVMPDIEDRVDIEDYLEEVNQQREYIKKEREKRNTKTEKDKNLETQNVEPNS